MGSLEGNVGSLKCMAYITHTAILIYSFLIIEWSWDSNSREALRMISFGVKHLLEELLTL